MIYRAVISPQRLFPVDYMVLRATRIAKKNPQRLLYELSGPLDKPPEPQGVIKTYNAVPTYDAVPSTYDEVV